MSNTRETVRALVSAFNVNNYDFNAVKTNFKLQSRYGEDCIVVSFDKSMDTHQCRRYLDSIKRKIVGEFYDVKYEVVLNTGRSIFDVKSFPFNTSKGEWLGNEQNGFKFVTPIDQDVIFNLKSHLAASLAKDVLEYMPTCNFSIEAPNKKGYLWHGEFDNKGLREKKELHKEFESNFLLSMKERYENAPKNPLKVEGNSVYIKDVFDDARFIDSITRRAAWRIGRDLQADSKSRSDVRAFKNLIMEFINQPEGLIATGFMCAPPLNEKGASILIPVISDSKGFRALTNKEALSINGTFDGAVFVDINGKTQAELPVNGSSGIYGINFYDLQISHCVITKIIENSVINKDHELSIDPELPRTLLTESSWRRARQGELLYNQLGLAGTSGRPSSQLNSTAVNRVIESGKCAGAAENVPAGTSAWDQPITNRLLPAFPGYFPSSAAVEPSYTSSLGTSGNERPDSAESGYLGSPGPLQLSKPLSSEGANLVGANPCSSQGTSGNKRILSMQFTEPGLIDLPWTQSSSGSSLWKDAAENVQAGTSTWNEGSWSSWPQSGSSQISNLLKEDCKKIYEDFEEAYEKFVSDSSLSKEERELSKALLYWFNVNNYALDLPHTNFIVKNGKITSLIDDSVDVKEYLQEVIDRTKEEYCVNKKEAYDLNEFPFKFLSNCEKNQETTVVANISRGALLNLKELFSQKHKGKVEIKDIDINIVKKAVKSEKDEWVNFQVREHGLLPKAAIETCCPDESALEYISITKGEGGHWIERDYDASEVKSFKEERWPAKGTSKAKKMKSKDNKDSGYSSGFVTDAENVSSKADAITSSGYESMDCENTREGLPKRSLEFSMENLAISTTLNAPQPSPAKKLRNNEV